MSAAARPRISVCMITLNGERLLEQVLESVRWADEIVIVDSGSTDRTEEIALRYTPHFHPNPYRGHGLQRQRSLALSSGEWVLYVDADEVVTPRLRRSIEAAVRQPGGAAGFRVQLHTWILGRWFGRRGWRREWKVRLFRRDAGGFDDAPIHEGAIVSGPIGTLSGVLLHYPYRDLAHFIEKMNDYSTGMATRMGARGGSVSAAGAVARGFAHFLRDYLLGGDFLYGGAGLVRSAVGGYYTFLKYAKVWESARGASSGEAAADATSGTPARGLPPV